MTDDTRAAEPQAEPQVAPQPEPADQQPTERQADLVLEGGGVRGIALASAVATLAETYTFRRIAGCLLYTSPSPRDVEESRMPSSA